MVSEELRPYDGCVLPPQASAIEELRDWAINFDSSQNPFAVFLDIIGWSVDRYGCYIYRHELKNCGEIFGYKELCLLADALKVFESNGFDQVYDWCDKLVESESED